MSKKHFRIQLVDILGKLIQTAGGVAYVCANGDYPKIAVATSADGTAATSNNPISLDYGLIEFWTATTVNAVDIYVQCPNGEFVVEKNVLASGPNEIVVPPGKFFNMQIPFSADDITANTETETGFTEPSNAIMLPEASVYVGTIDATETIEVGTLSTDSGDADGFIDGVSVATAGVVKGTVANGANTKGALFEVQDSANAGDIAPEGHVSGGKSITVTTSAGTDTAEGIINLPYMLCA